MRLARLVALALAATALVACSEDPLHPQQRAPRALRVDPYAPDAYPTIQSALAVSIDGDTISLVNGRHSGPGNRDIDLGSRSIVIRSERGDPLYCIVDADGAGILTPEHHFNFRFRRNPMWTRPPVVTVENLRIEDGYEAVVCDSGTAPVFRNVTFERSNRAVTCMSASPIFIDCSFDNNQGGALICRDSSSVTVRGGRVWQNLGYSNGAGIAVLSSTLRIDDCLFIRNTAVNAEGSAIYASRGPASGRSTIAVTNCRFQDNGWNEATWQEYTDFLYDTCVFYGNGGPMFVYNASAGRVVGSIFYAEGVYLDSGSSVSIESSIIAFNGGGPGVHCGFDGTARVSLLCSDLYGNSDECILDQLSINGNLSVDPLFCDATSGNFGLRSDSPLLANPNCGPNGGWTVTCDPPLSGSSFSTRAGRGH